MMTAEGIPCAAWVEAMPDTASASPPVLASQPYSAARWTTPIAPFSVPPSPTSGARYSPDTRGSGREDTGWRFTPAGRGIVVVGVVLHHPPGGESLARDPERVLHPL